MVRLTILPACLRCIGIPTARRRVEQPLPNCHHSTLLESGVVGYDRAALTEDYRLAVLWQAATSIRQAMSNIPPDSSMRRVHDSGLCDRAWRKPWTETKPSSGCVRRE
jgi:hypothetical protein